MNAKKRSLLLILALVVILGAATIAYRTLGSGSSEQVAQESGGEEDAAPVAAPDFTVYDADGNEITLSSLLGKPAVLNFWASTCPPCRAEMPHFQAAYEELGEDVAFIMIDGVGSMNGETQEAGETYIQEEGYTFPVYFDTDQNAVYTYGISAFPTTYFIDADGNLVARGMGQLSEEALDQGLAMILPES